MQVSSLHLVRTSKSLTNLVLVLSLICVHPDFQRRGLGKDLVQWGLRQAADLGLSVHLEASPEGLPLYQSLCFEVVETLVVRADQWDGGSERQYVVMLWEPTSGTLGNSQH